eukprot:2758071-Pleurochrysis_carterae.AAC.1
MKVDNIMKDTEDRSAHRQKCKGDVRNGRSRASKSATHVRERDRERRWAVRACVRQQCRRVRRQREQKGAVAARSRGATRGGGKEVCAPPKVQGRCAKVESYAHERTRIRALK